MSVKNKTFTILLLFVSFAFFFVGAASAVGHADATMATTPTAAADTSITPTPGPTASPAATASATPAATTTATPTPTAVPTPAPRQVFSTATASWSSDHETISIVNNGAAITVIAWIDNPSKKATISVGAGESMSISTPSIQAQNGQIVSFGFAAYENNTLIDSYNNTIAAIAGPTPTALPSESVTISGIVTDTDTGTAIANATVTFRSVSYEKTYPPITTDSDGSYTSQKMYPDVYTITVSSKGYQATSLTTNGKITGDATVAAIPLKKLAGASTPTPLPSTPTPSIPVDSWASLPYNPALCVGTISSLIAVIAGTIGIYEWMERKRNDRRKDKKEGPAKGGDKQSEPSTPGEKKP